MIFWQDIIEEYPEINKDIHFMFIISPKRESIPEVLAMSEQIGLKDIYIDDDFVFFEQNRHLLSVDKRFNVFLLDRKNVIKLIGSPLGNKRMDKLYRKHIKKM